MWQSEALRWAGYHGRSVGQRRSCYCETTAKIILSLVAPLFSATAVCLPNSYLVASGTAERPLTAARGQDPTLKTDTDVGLHSKGTAVFLKSKKYARTDHSKWNSCFTQMESLGICITGLEFSAGVLDQGVAGDSPALARALPFRPTSPDLIGSNVYSPSSPTRASTAAHSPASSSSCSASSAHHRYNPRCQPFAWTAIAVRSLKSYIDFAHASTGPRTSVRGAAKRIQRMTNATLANT